MTCRYCLGAKKVLKRSTHPWGVDFTYSVPCRCTRLVSRNWPWWVLVILVLLFSMASNGRGLLK